MSTQLIFKTLKLRNFLSFGNNITEIDLTFPGSTLIQGKNVDANTANGSGKTTIINALCYALFNKPFDNISLQRLINATNNTKNTLMEVRLEFQKGDDEYEIYRCRGETFNIQITMNGDDITLDSVNENDKLVEEIIGISYDLFTKIIIFSGNSMPFLMTPVSQQRNQIEELFNITLLTEKAVKLKEIMRATENKISVQEAIVREQESQVALYEKQLNDANNRVINWEKQRATQIEFAIKQLELMHDIDMETEKELHSHVDRIKKQLNQLENSYKVTSLNKSNLSNDVSKLISELAHLKEDKCPYCLQQYEGANNKIEEKDELLKAKQESLVKLEEDISKFSLEIESLSIEKAEAAQFMKFDSLADAVKAESAASTAQQKIDDLRNTINPHIEAYEQLKNTSIKSISYSEIDNLKKELEHQQFLHKLLTDKNSFIRRKIINKTIPFLNNRLMNYTKELGLPHVVKFDDDMSCAVSEYGRELDFGNLSSGEKKRVNLSMSLAFRDVLHQLHSKVNCLFIDEIDASLDTSGVENVFKLLKNKSRDDNLSLWIISHRPEAVGRFDRNIVVRKENGFSSIVSEEIEEQ